MYLYIVNPPILAQQRQSTQRLAQKRYFLFPFFRAIDENKPKIILKNVKLN